MAGKRGVGVTTLNGLGERVRKARKELGLSQSQLAGEELTKGFISQLESGVVRPSIRSLQVIAQRLGKPLDYLLGDAPLATGKRVAFHRLAAEAAATRRDWQATREHAQRGLAEVADQRERAHLLHLLARAEAADRSFERTFQLVEEALGLVDVTTAPQLVAELLYLRGHAYFEIGQLVAASEAFEAALDVIERYEVIDPRLRSRLSVSLGSTYRRLKRTSKAITAYESALATASRSSELDYAARGYMGIAVTYYDSGELDAAISNYRRALELFQRVSDLEFELNSLQSIAMVQLENGQVDAAKTSAERALQRALQVGNARWAAVAEVILARVALREGRGEDALRMAKHGDKILGESHDDLQRADALGAIGAACEQLGRRPEADRAYRRSIELYTSIGDIADRSVIAAEYARVLKGRGNMDEAFDMLELARGAPAAR